MRQECPDCERYFTGKRCGCGFNPASLMEPSEPTPKDNARWLCRNRPEGEPCTNPVCEHPGSQQGETPTREALRALVAETTAKLSLVTVPDRASSGGQG